MNMRPIIYSLFALVLFAACSKNTFEDVDDSGLDYDYFPLSLGKTWTYQMDSIVYDPEPGGTVVDTIRQQVRLFLADTFRDGENRLTYRVDRFLRNADTSSWEIHDVWSVVRDEGRLIWTEENIPFVKLTFPPKLGQVWEGNALIDEDQVRISVRSEILDMFKFWNDYRITAFGENLKLNGKEYSDVLTVLQADREILIEKRYSEEKYAKGVGLIYKKLEVLDTQDTNTGVSFYNRAERGFILELKLLSHQ